MKLRRHAGFSERVRTQLDLKFHEDLKQMRHEYDDVLPCTYIEHLKDKHCPLDEQATKEVRKYYFHPWDHSI